jgi:hypothetical protein
MPLSYGFVKCTVAGGIRLARTPRPRETQFHLHAALTVEGSREPWDAAVNVGSDNDRDLLRYRFASALRDNPFFAGLAARPQGRNDLTGLRALPALDFLRSGALIGTGSFVQGEPMTDSTPREPYLSLARLLEEAREGGFETYIFGRFYQGGSSGIHDVHMNQGSTGSYLHRTGDDRGDHNDVWQDGALFVRTGETWAAYCTAFSGQLLPTDALGNPAPGAHPMNDADVGRFQGRTGVGQGNE